VQDDAERDLDDLLEDGYALSDDGWASSDDHRLGQVAMRLDETGQRSAAALMLDVKSLDQDGHHEYCDGCWGEHLVLEVEPWLVDRFTDEWTEQILDAFNTVADGGPWSAVMSLRVRATRPDLGKDWRDQLSKSQMGDVSNQAVRPRLDPTNPREDNLTFTNNGELAVYRVLKAKQAALPPSQTIGIMPLGGMRVLGYTREPDFLITYQGRAGVIEVDGPQHRGKRAGDKSRDQLLVSAGVAWVDRIDVSDASNPQEVAIFVDTFLVRMLERK
jgi:hypothetical protein